MKCEKGNIFRSPDFGLRSVDTRHPTPSARARHSRSRLDALYMCSSRFHIRLKSQRALGLQRNILSACNRVSTFALSLPACLFYFFASPFTFYYSYVSFCCQIFNTIQILLFFNGKFVFTCYYIKKGT